MIIVDKQFFYLKNYSIIREDFFQMSINNFAFTPRDALRPLKYIISIVLFTNATKLGTTTAHVFSDSGLFMSLIRQVWFYFGIFFSSWPGPIAILE